MVAGQKSKFRLYLVIFVVGYCCFAIFTMHDYGISWDEPMRWRSGDQKLEYYQSFFSDEDVTDIMRKAPNDLYPGLYDIPLAWARSNLDVDPVTLSRIWNSVWGGLLLVGTIFLCRFCLSLRSVSENERLPKAICDLLPFFSAIVLLMMPELMGHLFINPKDVPFAAAYVWALFALCRVVVEFPKPRLSSILIFGGLVGASMSIRPPGVVAICYYGLFAILWSVVVNRETLISNRIKNLGLLFLKGALSLALATAIMFPFWPKAHRNIWSSWAASIDGVDQLKTFASSKPVLYAGEFFHAGQTPWEYPIWMFAIKQPEWLLLLLVLGLFLAFSKLGLIGESLLNGDKYNWAVAVTLFAVLFPIVFVIVTKSSIHNGYRHMFYTLPPVAVLAVITWKGLLLKVWEVVRWRRAIYILSGLCVCFSVFSMTRLYPYQYISYNGLVGGPTGAYGRYETDYWFIVGKAGAEIVLEDSQSGKKIFVLGPKDVVSPYLPEGFEVVDSIESADYYLGRPMRELEGVGRVAGVVERMGMTLLVVIHLKSDR